MDGYRISEVAERTGFSPATLRYYEEIGVVPPPGRSEAGYRVYDERAFDRLDFVGRAKELGLTLEEIADLTELWDDDACRPVQRRLAEMVADRLAATGSRIAELTATAARLRTAANRLAEEPQAGPCDAGCACNARAAVAAPALACTLAAEDQPGRVSEWEALVGRAVGREPLDGGVRLRFAPEPGLAAELAALAEAEHGCCAFFEFAVGFAADRVTLDVRAPLDAAPLVAELFGSAP